MFLTPSDSALFIVDTKESKGISKVISIGRSSGADIVLENDQVSKLHAYFHVNYKKEWSLRDGRSVNGSYVNGSRLLENETRVLKSGAIVSFGESLQFKFLSPEDMFTHLLRVGRLHQTTP